MNLPTPKYDLSNFPEVYEPSEDTFLFLDALESEQTFLKNLQPTIAVEIGSGSGVVITALSSLLKTSCCCLATDINPQGCLATRETSKINNATVDCVNMDLLTFFNDKFDVILFNPPYVVTETEEVRENNINRAFAGGRNGREVMDRVLRNLRLYLSERGVCYMVLLKENKVEEVVEKMEGLKYKSVKVMERKIPGEHLYVYKFFSVDTN